MDYKNDNRTPRDRITGEFLSELLFTEKGGECECTKARTAPVSSHPRKPVYREKAPVCCAAKNSCTRKSGVQFAGEYSLAMAYVPMQSFGDLFELEEGFCQGTIFKELRFPFYPTPCRKEGDTI